MKNLLFIASLILPWLLLTECRNEPPAISSWQHPLYLDNNNFWRQRIPVIIENNSKQDLWGDPVVIKVGKGKGEIPLKGVLAEAVRLTNSEGTQLLYRLSTPDGMQIEKGPIPANSELSIPLECDAGQTFTCFLYYDNPSAWPVGEYYYTHSDVRNGGFETGDKFGPMDWELEWPHEEREVKWTREEARTGNYSLVVTSSEGRVSGRDNRIGYGASQSDVHLMPGASYEIEAWFKTENLDGEAGLTLLPANLKLTKLNHRGAAIPLKANGSSGDWHRASAEFTAEEDVNIMSINTFLQGTGKLWVDDVQISCQTEYDLTVRILSPEILSITESGQTDQWFGAEGSEGWPVRASIMVPNFSNKTLKDYPVYVDIQMLRLRLFDEIDDKTLIQVTDGTNPIPYLEMKHGILFKQDIPPSTVHTYYIYFSNLETSSLHRPLTYTDLSEITANLIVDPSFDDPGIPGWERFGEGPSTQISTDKEDGNSMLILRNTGGEEENHSKSENGMGVFKEYDVEAGNSYFFSVRVKCSDILNRTFTLRTHFLDENGDRTGEEKTQRANPDLHQNHQWVNESMIIRAPTGSKRIRVELVNTGQGVVWYDDVFFMETGSGYTGALSVERKAERDIEDLRIWEKNPIAKAFPDDLPTREVESVFISAAKRDVEPVQLLFRSQDAYENLEVKLGPLTDDNGNRLEHIEIGVVGYVPVSYPSNYFRNYSAPFWHTKLPVGKIGSDGWTGWWADPILPFSNFDLPANETRATWIEVDVPDDARAGIYSGKIQVLHKGQVLREIPLKMQVYDFTLPETTSMIALYVLRYSERYWMGREKTSEEWKIAIWELMKKHKLSPKAIQPEPIFSLVDGEVVADFTEFDKAAEIYFNEMKFKESYSPHRMFYVFGWGRTPGHKFGEAPYEGEPPYPDADHSKFRPEYKRIYQSALKLYWDHMKEKGWADKTLIYISDEPHPHEQMNKQIWAACDMIHEVDPEIPIYVSTWWYRPEFEGYVDIWGLSHRGGGWGHPVPAEHMELAVKNGGKVYFTTDGAQCTDTPFLGFERMLPYFCYKYGASEYEFWSTNWYTLNPYQYGWHTFHRVTQDAGVYQWIRYPNGDGNFIYPGKPIGVDGLVTTIRLKQAREGVEDYEFLNALDQLIQKSNAKGIETDQASLALKRALNLVNIPCADGRYTTGYTPDPDLLMEIRHEIASSIETLSSKLFP